MRCTITRDRLAGSRPPTSYEAELAEMNRARAHMFTRLRCLGLDPATALEAVNAGKCPACAASRAKAVRSDDWGWCAICDESWTVDPRTAITQRIPASPGRQQLLGEAL